MRAEVDPASPPQSDSDVAASGEAPLPVIAYAEPVVNRTSWHRNALWAQLALPAGLSYAVAFGCTLAYEMLSDRHWSRPADDAILRTVAVTSPLGILAVALGVLGHFSPGGRRMAGPALWLVTLTPGVGAILFLMLTLAVAGSVRSNFAATCASVAGVNAIVVLALRNRVLRESPEERLGRTRRIGPRPSR